MALNPISTNKSEYSEHETTDTRQILPLDNNPRTAGQCVNWVKWVTGVSFTGDAILWWRYVNSQTAKIDSIVVMKNGKYGHVGIVVDRTDTEIVVRSRNFRGLWIVSDDRFDINDPDIVGYIDLDSVY